MRILGIDEIPDTWKEHLDTTGRGRYVLFTEELSNVHFVLEKSTKTSIAILEGLQGQNFPYMDFKIGKPITSRWKALNRPGHMGVLIEDSTGKQKFLECSLDSKLMVANLKQRDLPNITI